MEAVADDDHAKCHGCDSIAHEPEKVGERIHLYTKTALACRPHATLDQLESSCLALAEQVSQWNDEGFEVVQSSPDGHIFMERMDGELKTDEADQSTSHQ
jgi:hypothetical protein